MYSIDAGASQARKHKFHLIPQEMKLYRQFVVWKYVKRDDGKPTKVLFSARNGLSASVSNPSSWDSFDNAVKAYEAGEWSGIGFVFTKNDPYAGIDLDDAEDDAATKAKQDAIYNEFVSYAEVSPSGYGLHIIVRGSVSRGRRNSKIEIYSDERYFTMTGNVYRDAPIADYHALLNARWHEMRNDKPDAPRRADTPQSASDAEIIRRALNAGNGSKFHSLHTGLWRGSYPSQNEADFAYVDMLAFFSRNRAQIDRLFLASPLGARPKAQRRDYRARMIERSFDLLPPPIDTSAITAQIDAAIAAKRAGGAK